MHQPNRRRRKLIQPRLQLHLSATFAGISVFALVLQTLYFSSLLTDVSQDLGTAGNQLIDLAPGLLGRSVLFGVGVVVPLTIVVGVLVTFRIAGPLYRIETYLAGLGRGEETEPCRLRRGDRLHQLCRVMNEATEPLRRRNAERREAQDVAEEPPAAEAA